MLAAFTPDCAGRRNGFVVAVRGVALVVRVLSGCLAVTRPEGFLLAACTQVTFNHSNEWVAPQIGPNSRPLMPDSFRLSLSDIWAAQCGLSCRGFGWLHYKDLSSPDTERERCPATPQPEMPCNNLEGAAFY